MRPAWLLLPCCVACGEPPEPKAPDPEPDAAVEEPTSAVSHGEGPSCREAMASEADSETPQTAEQETIDAVKSVLNEGKYLNRCRVTSSASVEICAAIRHGEALGVTVEIDPGNQAQADCVAGEVQMLEYPSSPTLIRASTVFEPSLN